MKTAASVATLLARCHADSSPSVAIRFENVVMNAVESAPSAKRSRNMFGTRNAIRKASELLNIKHKILPVSIDNSTLCAELEDGTVIKGETNIDIPKHDGSIKIKRIFLEPKAVIYREAYDAIVEADFIVIGPGDLYTSILPNFLVESFREALNNTEAKIAYILNIMTKWGETNGFKASDFVKNLLSYTDRKKIDYVICNGSKLKKEIIEKYKGEKAEPVEIDAQELKKYANSILKEDIAVQSKIIRHDPQKTSLLLMKLD